MKLSYLDRASHCKNILGKKLFTLMTEKKSNLALSADITKAHELLELADTIGPEICVLKTHIDIIEDFTPALTKQLQKIAEQHRFLIFEDRKFADIGNTVKHQYRDGVYHIADWADMVNAHILPGPGVIQGLAEVGMAKSRGLLLLAQMSSKDNLLTPEYAQQTLAMAKKFEDFVFGFISQKKLSDEPQWVYLTPGVQFSENKDALGQQYVTPEQAICENGTDVIIVGRGIFQAKDPVFEAKKYRELAWECTQK